MKKPQAFSFKAWGFYQSKIYFGFSYLEEQSPGC
jgi:hypothetical protein